MKKLLYIAAVNLDDNYSGITKKIKSQFREMSKFFDVYLIGYSKKGIMIMNQDSIKQIKYNKLNHRKLDLISVSIELVQSLNIKKIYIRRFPCNFIVIKMLKNLKQNENVKILWEIPTYPYDYEQHNIAKSKIYMNLDKIYRRKLKKYIDRIVTFSDEKNIFNIPCINTGNGIIVDDIKERKILKSDNKTINLIAVGIFNNWHGYERMIEGINNYYKKKQDRKIIFHLVGNGPDFEKYKKLVDGYNLNKNVILYGYLDKNEVDLVYDKCEIAVESLGWHRSKVNVGTSLKSREYLAKGLPIIASSNMDIFPNGWEYALYVSKDDSPIDIDKLVHFYDTIYTNHINKYELNKKIRNIAYEKCDMEKMILPVVEYFLANDSNEV